MLHVEINFSSVLSNLKYGFMCLWNCDRYGVIGYLMKKVVYYIEY